VIMLCSNKSNKIGYNVVGNSIAQHTATYNTGLWVILTASLYFRRIYGYQWD